MTDQPELFSYTPADITSTEKMRQAKTIAQGVCPSHPWAGKLTGIIRDNKHYYWRAHTVRSLNNRPRPCTASDAPLHSAPAIDIPFQPHPHCPCERRS